MNEKLTKEELEARTFAKMNAIMMPKLSEKEKQTVMEKNRLQDKNNLEHTVKILSDRRQEAETDQDQRKKFHAISIEKTQKDQFNVRERLHLLETQYAHLKAAMSEEDWALFSEFWECGNEVGLNDSDIGLHFREMGLEPKDIVHFMNMLKLKREIEELKKNIFCKA